MRKPAGLIGFGWAAILLCEAVIGASAQQTEPRAHSPGTSGPPNIVVFVSDDQGWKDIGYHDSEIDTPNLDRLARTGVRLEQFYVYPTCSPTRAALLTGRNPSRFNILGPIGGRSEHVLPKDTATLPGRLRQIGYRTAIAGKWHLGLRPEVGPRQYGFDFSYGYFHGQVDPYTHYYKNGDRTWHRNDKYVNEVGHVTDLLAREAIRFIEQYQGKPFFLYVPFSVPHYPLNEPEHWTKPYAERIENNSRRWFAASVTHMDHAIGEICSTIDRLGLADNTLIVFTSDNGGQQSWASSSQYDGRYAPHDRLGDNRPLRGWKVQLHEGGIRVPAFMCWPKRLKPGVVNAPTSVLDLMPTLMYQAGWRAQPAVPGAEDPAGAADALLEGVNIWPLLTGKPPAAPRTLYWKTGGQYALRKGDFKLIQARKGGQLELFNLAKDPYETTDLAKDEPERVRELLEELGRQKALDPGQERG